MLGFASTAPPVEADLLIANVGTNSILRYDEANNTLSTFSSGDHGALQVPYGMAYGPDGNLYVTSLGTGSILEYNGKTGAFLGTFVPHTVGSTTLQYPNAIAFDPNNSRYLYISDYFDNRIDRYDMRTSTLSVYALLPTTAASANHLQGPTGLVFGFDGNLYVNNSTQSSGSQIRQYNVEAGDTTGRSIIGGLSDSITHLNAPAQLAFGPTTAVNPPLLLDTGFLQNSVNSYQLTYQRGQIVGEMVAPDRGHLAGRAERAGRGGLRSQQRSGHHQQLPGELAGQRELERDLGRDHPGSKEHRRGRPRQPDVSADGADSGIHRSGQCRPRNPWPPSPPA